MSCTVTKDPQAPYVEMVLSGNVPAHEVTSGLAQTLELMAASRCALVLADCSTLTGGHSISDLFARAENASGESAVRGCREAIVLPSLPSAQELARFWETVCVNRGIDVRSFTEREAAVAWLTSA